MAMITRRYGQAEGGVPALWTPGLMIAGLAIGAVIWMTASNRRGRRNSRRYPRGRPARR